MVTTEPAEVTASETRPPGFRIRWGWFLGCITSGLVAIVVGWSVVAPASHMSYLAGVLANVGTTLLLLGIVVLLERRIVDHAVRKFRNAAEEARRSGPNASPRSSLTTTPRSSLTAMSTRRSRLPTPTRRRGGEGAARV